MTRSPALRCPGCGAGRAEAEHGGECRECGADWPVFEA